jgi:hypothetical protein
MPFALGAPFSVENCSGDLLHFPPWRATLVNAIGQRRFTTKASAIVGTVPGPMPVRPPAGSELLDIMCSGDGERLPMNFVTEDAESAARVKVGSNNQNPTVFHLSQALGRVMGFVRRRLGKILHVPKLSRGCVAIPDIGCRLSFAA